MTLQTVKGMRPLSEATRLIGRQKFLESVYLASLNDDPVAQAFWDTFQQLSGEDQQKVPFDEVALAAGVQANELMGAAVNAAMVLGSRTSEMVFASMQPGVVRQMMKSAMRIGGKYAQTAMLDRHKILQHGAMPFLPAPHGQTINVNASSKSDAKAAAAAKANTNPSVPDFLEDMDDLDGPKQEVQRRLEETTARVVDVDADV